MKRFRLSLIFLLMMVSTILTAQTADLEQRIANADSLTVGSIFDLYFSSNIALGTAVVPDTLTEFKVLSNKREGMAGKPEILHLQVIPLKTGALSFPQLHITALKDTTISFTSDRFRVNVQSVLAPGDTLLREIKPVQRYPLELPWWLYLLLIGISIALLIVVIVMFVVPLFKRVKPIVAKGLPSKAPWQLALEALQALLAQDLNTQNRTIEFYYALSLILRTLLEQVHGFNAIEMTTTEIRAFLRSGQSQLASEKQVIDFLQYCDKVKFAKHAAAQSHIDEHVQWLQDYIMSTIPPKTEPAKDA